jgi:hypothetical protein
MRFACLADLCRSPSGTSLFRRAPAPVRRLAAAMSLAAMLIGCASGDDGGDAMWSCARTLDEYCSEHGCKGFDESLAAARHEVADGQWCFPWVEVGVCGPYRFIATSYIFSGGIEYFDANGMMVGATWGNDGPSCNLTYGLVPDCTEEVSERLCESSADAGSGDGL